MSELENIPKKDFFRVPANYFEDLPRRIRERLESEKPERHFRPVLRYATVGLASLALILAMIIFSRPARQDAESILASVQTAELIEYLQESDASIEELVDNSSFSDAEIEALEQEAFMFEAPNDVMNSDSN